MESTRPARKPVVRCPSCDAELNVRVDMHGAIAVEISHIEVVSAKELEHVQRWGKVKKAARWTGTVVATATLKKIAAPAWDYLKDAWKDLVA